MSKGLEYNMEIKIKVVPKKKIRNDSVGDYKKGKKGLEILVAKVGDKVFQKGVAIHELVESLLVKQRKIPFSKIDKWDKEHLDVNKEPGEIQGSPYFKEHAIANKTENILVKELKKKKNGKR